MIARFFWLAGAASTALLASSAYAQEAPVPADDQLQETARGGIVVTARRREEAIQDVPLAISVIDDKVIEGTGSFNVARLTQLQPSLTFYSTNPRNSSANIRGLGAPLGLTNDGIEQGVGIYIDQVYNSRIAAATFDFLDVERIEVLRGPQGTLYGKNTTAGAINITTRQPTFNWEGRAEATVGNLDYFQAKAAISGPIIDDVLAFRVAASINTRRGTIYNVATNEWVNGQDNQGIRAQLLWKAGDNLNLTLAGDYSQQDPNCCAQIYVRTTPTQRALNRQYAALIQAVPSAAPPSTNAFDRLTNLDAELRAKQSLGGVSLRAEWDLGFAQLTSVSAWRFWKWDPSNDRDFTGADVTTLSQNPSYQEQWTQEFRLASLGKNTIDYTVGLFAFHQTLTTNGLQQQGADASRWTLNPGSGSTAALCLPGNTARACNPAVLDGLTSINNISLKSTSLAAFGQLTWNVTDRLRLQPGIRLNYDKKVGQYDAQVFDGAGNPVLFPSSGQATGALADQLATLPPQSYPARFSQWNLSYDFTISYDVARDVLAYATYARSYKSGGINLSGLPLDSNNLPIYSAATVKPEKVNHFELGLKTQFLDNRATFNLAGFWTEIEDYQAIVNAGAISTVRGYLANADKIRVRGIEGDFAYRPSDRFNVYVSGAYTDHEYVSFKGAPCRPELQGGGTGAVIAEPGTPGNSPASCDISGQWLPGISNWSFTYGAEYNFPTSIFGQDGEAYISFDGSYRSKFSSNATRSASTDIDGYTLANFRLGYRVRDKIDVYGWVRNAFNEEYYEVLATTPGSTGLIVGQPADPRTFGLTVRTQF